MSTYFSEVAAERLKCVVQIKERGPHLLELGLGLHGLIELPIGRHCLEVVFEDSHADFPAVRIEVVEAVLNHLPVVVIDHYF